MTTTYEQTTVTQTSSGTADSIRPDLLYVKSISGILKIVQMVLCVIVLICSSVDAWWAYGGGWVQFVAASALITTIILFIFHFMRIISRLPGPWIFIEFIYYCIYSVLWLIAAIVCAARAGWTGAIAASCVFAFAATAVYAVDTFFMYRNWQGVGGTTTTTTANTGAATATTTTTSYETRTQY